MVKGIDVSEWQGVIDWDKVKAAGIQFAIIRTGWGKTGIDKQFKRNVSEARRVGIKVGLYHYSYATSVNAAQAEAAHVINLVKGMGKFDLPIYFDIEESNMFKNAVALTTAFNVVIEQAGYWAGVYASTYVWKVWLKSLSRFTKWIAQWGANDGEVHEKPTIEGCDLHQYTSKGHIPGINGEVDVDVLYRETLWDEITGNTGKTNTRKSNDEVVAEIWNGLWGNGEERKERLTKAGYDYDVIQALINKSAARPTYTVKAGDNLTKIAKAHNTTVQKLKKINNLPNANLIYPGQVIRLG